MTFYEWMAQRYGAQNFFSSDDIRLMRAAWDGALAGLAVEMRAVVDHRTGLSFKEILRLRAAAQAVVDSPGGADAEDELERRIGYLREALK